MFLMYHGSVLCESPYDPESPGAVVGSLLLHLGLGSVPTAVLALLVHAALLARVISHPSCSSVPASVQCKRLQRNIYLYPEKMKLKQTGSSDNGCPASTPGPGLWEGSSPPQGRNTLLCP